VQFNLGSIMRRAAPVALVAGLIACSDEKPPHYYVLCDAKDGEWSLIHTESTNGYIMSCTYQSPDQQQTRVLRCRPDGCD